MNGVWSEDKWQSRGDTIKICSPAPMNVNTSSMFHDELLQYTELLEKIPHAEKNAHVTAESEAGNGHISTYFFIYSFFFVTFPQRSICSLKNVARKHSSYRF